MKYYVPQLELGVLLPQQVVYQDKFGGLPWGLDQNLWPICRSCKRDMVLIAQFEHNDYRLNLGRKGRVLYIFQCDGFDGGCDITYDPDGGANSCFIVEPEELLNRLAYPPYAANFDEKRLWSLDNIGFYNKENRPTVIWTLTEARVSSWLEREDGLSEQHRKFFEGGYWDQPNDLPDLHWGTRLGGFPSWIQYPELEGWAFLGQMSGGHIFSNPIPTPDEVGCPVGKGKLGVDFVYYNPKQRRFDGPRYICELDIEVEQKRSGGWVCEGPNFGDAGIGYFFLEQSTLSIPKCKFIWQCH